jgi:mRNA interferase MazF
LARGDIVLILFPFTDLAGQKLRPALIVGRPSGDDVIVAFMTSQLTGVEPRAEHLLAPTDPEFAATGLNGSTLVRLNKLATLHRRLVQRRLGRIGPATEQAVARGLRYVFTL